ncbi:MAG TPA: hypothetical protein VHX38_37490 [Pseudonocardiaceae bacterium]|jgi:hypothetical protein|nr:hypothetical protein [Pseudonocardiaceae bacterium]
MPRLSNAVAIDSAGVGRMILNSSACLMIRVAISSRMVRSCSASALTSIVRAPYQGRLTEQADMPE